MQDGSPSQGPAGLVKFSTDDESVEKIKVLVVSSSFVFYLVDGIRLVRCFTKKGGVFCLQVSRKSGDVKNLGFIVGGVFQTEIGLVFVVGPQVLGLFGVGHIRLVRGHEISHPVDQSYVFILGVPVVAGDFEMRAPEITVVEA
jgi:hypothetical protein